MARAHTADNEKHGNMATTLLRVLSFLLSVQGIPAAEKIKKYSYMQNFPHTYHLCTADCDCGGDLKVIIVKAHS